MIAPPPPSMTGYEMWSLVLLFLDAVATVVVIVVALLALRRIAAAAESTARAAGASQEALRQIQTATVHITKSIAS